MKIPIVNEQDEIIGYKDREDRNLEDIIRITAIWITDENGNILLQQRKFDKKVNPNKWGPAASGTIEEGESYDSNAYKELEEETGIKDIQLVKSKNFFGRTTSGGRRFAQLYLGKVSRDQKLIPQESEVQQLKWFSVNEFKNFLKEKPNDFVGIIEDIVLFLNIQA